MSLVAYESSDGSDEDEPSPEVIPKTLKPTASPFVPEGSALDKLRSIATSYKGTIQIVAPSLAEIEDSSSDEDEPKLKVKNPSAVGSGLKALLPAAKSSVSTSKTTSLVPDSVKRSRPPPSLPPPKKVAIQDIVDDVDNFDGQFFPVGEPAKLFTEQMSKTSVQIAPDVGPSAPVVHSYPVSDEIIFESNQPAMSELQYKKIIASKFGETSADDIRILDVNVNDHLSQNREYIKTVSLETDDPEKAGEAPNPTVRRKNHILSLAHQAKQRELALKNEWAQNKVNKNQTRAKYGF